MTNNNSKTDPTPGKKSVSKAVERVKSYVEKAKEFTELDNKFSSAYGVDLGPINNPSDIVAYKMIKEAKERTQKGKEGGIPVIGNPLNQNTCLAGVCTIAANAGVKFNRMVGNLQSGIGTDKQGRKIPQYNPLFTSQLDRTGYYELQPGEKPKEGDLVQYFESDDQGELTPYHMEFITEDKGGGKYKTFNNYSLFNSGIGEAEVQDMRGTDASDRGRASNVNRFYRLRPEAALAAAGEESVPFIEEGNKLKKELASIRENAIDGENVSTFGVIFSGFRNNVPKDKLISDATKIASDKQFVIDVINELYKGK